MGQVSDYPIDTFEPTDFLLGTDAAGSVKRFSAGEVGTASVYNVKTYGATGDGETDDLSAIQTLINTVGAADGGTVFFPPGVYYVTNEIVLDTNNVSLMGAGINSSMISLGQNGGGSAYNDTSVIRCTANCQTITISDLSIRGKGGWQDTGTFGATDPAVQLETGCGELTLRKLKIDGGSINIEVNGYDHLLDDLIVANAYGALLSAKESGNFFRRIKADQLTPQGDNADLSARANTTAYTAGQYRTNDDGSNECVLQCTVGGTSGGSAPTNKNYGLNITDGSVTWQMMAPVDLISILIQTHNGGGGEFHFGQCDMSGAFAYSVGVLDDNSADNGIATFHQCIFSSPILIVNAKWVGFTLCEFGTDSVTTNDKPVTVASCWGSTSMSISGTATTKAANRNIT